MKGELELSGNHHYQNTGDLEVRSEVWPERPPPVSRTHPSLDVTVPGVAAINSGK